MGKGRAPCCDKTKVKRGPWSPEEDLKLIAFIHQNGHENWRAVPKQAGLLRCGKSCRLRWINYLRPDVKRGNFTIQEEEDIIKLHKDFGNKWSKIASYLPGRTDNEIKNVWNTHLKKRLVIKNWESSADESKMESSITSTSSSESFSTNKEPNLAKTSPNSEVNEQAMFQVTMSDEKIESNEVINEDPKESSNSFSFVTFTPNQQLCSPLTNLGPYDIENNNKNNTMLQEVDKPNHLIEIPWDSDEDFWKLIDNFESLQSSEVQLEGDPYNQTQNHVQENVQDGENMKWFHEFNNEFGILGETNDEFNNKDQFLPNNDAAELAMDSHTFDLGAMERTESELDLRNFQLWLMA